MEPAVKIRIFSNSQTTTKALGSLTQNSKLVLDQLAIGDEKTEQTVSHVVLWSQGHRDKM